MSRKATPTQLTPTMSRTLKGIVNSSTAPKSVSVRAHVVRMASTGSTDQQVAHALGITGKTVRRWRSRWNESVEALVALESKRNAAAFRRDLEDVLSDAPRSGAPPTFLPRDRLPNHGPGVRRSGRVRPAGRVLA